MSDDNPFAKVYYMMREIETKANEDAVEDPTKKHEDLVLYICSDTELKPEQYVINKISVGTHSVQEWVVLLGHIWISWRKQIESWLRL